ncbi:hypothetical protein HMPREF0326_00637 [Desulfovibrio sp. 3_1_syn3]|uniref:site-specific integrase n=1 Tax=Desulfovibrio sp. 3_1_syn3 TaxID=457398 RepID=UPI0001E12507|nr:site-specific integrase [Desulfovibrio sp. 3_1_syn3]EFL86863.1 hypothetical protein HMPREF0326_00637 [Desulfovibrio sp. 3_1_syn3]
MATIRKRGDFQWEVRVRRKGHPTQCKTFEIKADAERWARAVEKEMDGGAFISQKEAERTSLEEAFKRFIPEYIEKNLAHPKNEIVRAHGIMKYPFAKKSLVAIRGNDIAKLIQEREAQGRSPHTIARDIALISRLYEVARANWGMEGLMNPTKNVIKPKLPQGRTRRLMPGEEKKLLEASSKAFQRILRFALESSMRREEIASLTWQQVDLERCILFLPKTKNGEARTVPLSPAALAILKEIPRPEGERHDQRVFSYTISSITGAMRENCAKAGIKDLRFHDLRHEAISRLFENTDLDVMEIRMITGHKTLQMLARYTHLRAERLVERLAGAKRSGS